MHLQNKSSILDKLVKKFRNGFFFCKKKIFLTCMDKYTPSVNFIVAFLDFYCTALKLQCTYTALYCTVLHCTALHCTNKSALQCMEQ